MKRKIVQITTVTHPEEDHNTLVALCDDGTLWTRPWLPQVGAFTWFLLPAIPDPVSGPELTEPRKSPKVKRDILKQIINLRDDFLRSYDAMDGDDMWLRMPLKCWMALRKKAEETLDPGQASAAQVQLRAFISMAEKYNLINFSSPDGWVAYGTFLGMKVVVNQGGNLEVSRLRNPNA